MLNSKANRKPRVDTLEDRLAPAALPSPTVITASGPDRASIQAAVDQFRSLLGPLNPYVAGTQNNGAGRREVNWDDITDSTATFNQFPGDFYNQPSSSPRGVEFDGGTYYVSPPLADGPNPNPWHYQPFSSPQVMGAVRVGAKGIPLYDIPVDFFVPGTRITASVRGFGAVFCDVDFTDPSQSADPYAFLRCYDAKFQTLAHVRVPAAPEGLSFVGVVFDTPVIDFVDLGLGPWITTAEDPGHDVVALDDLIFGEPVISAPPVPQALVAAGAGPGMEPLVQVNRADGTSLATFAAFDPAFRGGVHVTTGDVNADGIEDVVVGAGPGGGPHVRVFDGAALLGGTVQQLNSALGSFFAYDPSFTGGVYVAVANIFRADGLPEIVTGAGSGGGPHVRVFDDDGSMEMEFFAYDANFRGGVTVAAGDLDGDGVDEVITGAGPGGGPHVQAFSSFFMTAHRQAVNLSTPSGSFFAYDPNFTGGVFVAAADTDADGRAEIITGAGAGGGPHVQVLDGRTLAVRSSFFAFDPGFLGGVRVAAADLDRNRQSTLILGAGAGGQPIVRWWDDGTDRDYFAFDRDFTGGVFVG